MATYFTADTHFGDHHILRHRGELFPTIEAHDEALIARWNEVVSPDDDIWHIGDFAADASRDYCVAVFERLQGRKHLVRGNHDTNRVLELPWCEPPVESLRLTTRDERGEERRWFLAHYAHRAWPGLWRSTRHLYGHTHARLDDTTRSCDVGVDAWDYRPVGIAAIVERQDAAVIIPEELLLKAAAEAARQRSP